MPSTTFSRGRALVTFAVLIGWLTVGALAVEPGLPSKTSVLAASLRAIGGKNPDPQFRTPDYLAIKFLGPRERASKRLMRPKSYFDTIVYGPSNWDSHWGRRRSGAEFRH